MWCVCDTLLFQQYFYHCPPLTLLSIIQSQCYAPPTPTTKTPSPFAHSTKVTPRLLSNREVFFEFTVRLASNLSRDYTTYAYQGGGWLSRRFGAVPWSPVVMEVWRKLGLSRSMDGTCSILLQNLFLHNTGISTVMASASIPLLSIKKSMLKACLS